jgi:hypothetical protein
LVFGWSLKHKANFTWSGQYWRVSRAISMLIDCSKNVDKSPKNIGWLVDSWLIRSSKDYRFRARLSRGGFVQSCQIVHKMFK